MARRFTWKTRLLTVVGTVVLTTCAAEIGLRSVRKASPVPYTYVGEFENASDHAFRYDETLGWVMKRSHSYQDAGWEMTYHSNADGLRCDPDAPPPRMKKRLAVVGDSQTWGTGVFFRETWGAMLADQLGGWECLNYAQPAYGIDQVWLSVRHCALRVKPDLLVVGVFRDDFVRARIAFRTDLAFNKPTFRIVDGELVRRTAETEPGAVWRYIRRHSRIWTLIHRTVHGGDGYRPLNLALLAAIRSDCDAAGVPVLFVHIPTEEAVEFPALGEWLGDVGARYLDPAWPEDSEPLYLPCHHLNAKGHRRIAEETFRYLEREGLAR